MEYPQLILRCASKTLYPDVCILLTSLENFGKGGSMQSLADDFYTIASTWDMQEQQTVDRIQELIKRNGRSKSAAALKSGFEKDQMKLRFLDAVYDIQRAGVIKVTNSGKSFQKILSTWIYDNHTK